MSVEGTMERAFKEIVKANHFVHEANQLSSPEHISKVPFGVQSLGRLWLLSVPCWIEMPTSNVP